MRTLRAAYNKAVVLKVADIRLYPFRNLKNPTGYKISDLETATHKRAVKTFRYSRPGAIKTRAIQHEVRREKFFLFSFYCRGMNFTNMAYLKEENCQTGRIVYSRAKTRHQKIFSIEILPPVQAIIEYFALHPFKGNHLLPILDDERHKTPQQQKTRIQSLLKKINRDLKELGEEAKRYL